MTRLKIDIVADVMCPWCIIGYKSLENAVEQLDNNINVDVEFHPFELNSQMVAEGEDFFEHMARKYRMTPEGWDNFRQKLTRLGNGVGFTFNLTDQSRVYNTFDAHRILYWAKEQGKQTEFELALFEELFTNNHDPSSSEVLVRVAQSLGLDGVEVLAILNSERYTQEVRQEQQQYLSQGVRSVPTYIINETYTVSGVQDPATFAKTLRQIADPAVTTA